MSKLMLDLSRHDGWVEVGRKAAKKPQEATPRSDDNTPTDGLDPFLKVVDTIKGIDNIENLEEIAKLDERPEVQRIIIKRIAEIREAGTPSSDTPVQLSKDIHWASAVSAIEDMPVGNIAAFVKGDTRRSVIKAATAKSI